MGKAAGQVTSQALLALIEKGNAADSTRMEEVRQLAQQYPEANTFSRHLIARHLVTKWQISQMLRGVWQLSIGKYRLREERGIGRIGRELTAEHISLGRKVVLKLVSRILTNNPERLQQFLQDFRKVAAIDHPNLVHSFDVDSEGQRFFVVTEFVDGDNLEQRVRREDPIPVEKAIPLLIQAAKGLAFAASQGLIHCDLKPANLVVDAKGNLKVTDLGYGRLIDRAEVQSDKSKPAQDQIFNVGVEYRAPELGDDHKEVTDHRVDLYSFGQTLFFLLSGATPENALTTSAERKQAIAERVSDLPETLAELYANLTAPRPEDRLSTWQEAIDILESLQSGSGVGSQVAETAKRVETEPKVAAKKTPASPSAPAPVKKKLAVAKPLAEDPVASPVEDTAALDLSESSSEVEEEPAFNFNFATPAKNGAKKATNAAPAKKAAKPAVVPTKATPAPPVEEEIAVEEEEIEAATEEVEVAETTEEPSFSFNFAAPEKKEKSKPALAAKKPVKKSVKDSEVEAEAADESTTKPKSKEKKQLDPKLLIIGGSVAALVMTALVVGVMYMLLGGTGSKPKQVAENPESKSAETKTASEKTKEKSVADDKQVASETATTPDAEKKEPDTKSDKVEEKSSNDTLSEANANSPETKPAIDTKEETATTTLEMPPVKTDEPKIELIGEASKTPPAKTEAPKPEVKAPPKPTPPPPKAAPPADPLKDLPKVFPLPEIVANKPQPIGKCVTGGKICVIELGGGEFAYKGKQSFSLVEPSQSNWDFVLSAKPGESETIVAQLRIVSDELIFEWKKEALDQTASPYLKNCLIRVSMGASQRQITFRAPVTVPPVKIDFDKPTPTKIAIDHLPDAKNIKVEILGAKDNGFPNAKPLPGSEFVPGESSTVVWVGEKENDTPLGIKFDGKPSVKGIDISYTARMKLSNTSNEEAPFIKAKFVKERKKIIDALPSAENMKKTVLDNASKEKDAKKKDEQLKKIEADYKLQIQDPVDHLNNINKMYEDVHQKATLHFRVVMDAGAGLDKIVLAQSEGAPVPEPPKKK